MTKQLVVNADDLGLSEPINDGIRAAYDEGVLSSASVAVVGDALTDALHCLDERPEMGRGVHVALTDGEPLCDSNDVTSLVSGDGSFIDTGSRFYLEWFRRRIEPSDIRREVRAQIECAQSELGSLDHLNSHMHVHMIPSVFSIFQDLAREYDIPHLRFSHEPLPTNWDAISDGYLWRMLFDRGMLRRTVLAVFARMISQRTHVQTDAFTGSVFVDRMTERTIASFLESNTHPMVEMCVHPGIYSSDCNLPRDDLKREHDLAGLVSDRVADLIEEEYELVTFAGDAKEDR